MGSDVAVLLLRVFVGVILTGHGLQKVSHLFGGSGLQGGAEEFRRDGFRGGTITALLAGLTQIGSGILLVAGFLTPLAAVGLIGVMTVAVGVKRKNGLWVQNDGYEFPLTLIIIGASLALSGAGAYSLDAVVGLSRLEPWVGAAADALGVAGGLMIRLLLHVPRPSLTSERGN